MAEEFNSLETNRKIKSMNKFLDLGFYRKKARRYWGKLYWNRRYDLDRVRELERRRFENAGFSFDDALKQLNGILRELGKPEFGSKNGIGSIHWILFCCISQVSSIKSILEIGTFDGETTLLLSKVFPDADIVTFDLPDDDPIFTTSYQREDPNYLKEFKTNQQNNLRDDRIEFIKKNSFFLPAMVDRNFDLIWIDGGHLYPEVSWDICNAYHLCSPGGWIMCDDVMLNERGYRDGYVSPDSHEILEYVRKRTNEEVDYFLKRETAKASADPRKRKHVAVLRKS